MLNTDLWNKISNNNQILYMCYDCIVKKLGREVTEDDLILTDGHHWLVNKWFLDNKVKHPKYKLIYEKQEIPCGDNSSMNINLKTTSRVINKNFSIFNQSELRELAKEPLNNITPEMEKYFRDYVSKHCSGVAKVATKLRDRGYITPALCHIISETHDSSKLEEPEYIPYVKRKWLEKVYEGTKFGDYQNMDQDVKDAIYHHVTTNKHHPEYWSPDYKGFDTKNPCHVNNMPEDYVIEMICDWKSMGDEQGNSIMDWFKKTDGSRWIWDDKTRNFILKWINIIDNL